MEEEEEAMGKFCSTMIVRVRNKQLQADSSDVGKRRRRQHKGGGGRERTQPERRAEFGDQRDRSLPLHGGTQRVTCPGPEVQPAPLQLVSTLRLQTLKEDVRRAAEVELHDPTACCVCERERASLALRGFIRRKKTRLQFQTLKGRLNTHLVCGVSGFKDRGNLTD
ncbi:uncharacterized protein C8orf48-like [Anabas testudineus]|uniref:uncharacterized protein C8orf48-like n=1 Tax=Anabas testudineus TaxID=64144 RepID=UPI000E45F264|nr:uncharacterized protein C8orf48-like [Anabas testudineus]